MNKKTMVKKKKRLAQSKENRCKMEVGHLQAQVKVSAFCKSSF
jgi:hypothetical protein